MPIGQIIGGMATFGPKIAGALMGSGKPSQATVDAYGSIRHTARKVAKGFIVARSAKGVDITDPLVKDGTPLLIKFQFNPPQLNKEYAVQYNEVVIPGAMQPFIEFIGGKSQKLDFELVFFAPMSMTQHTEESFPKETADLGFVANKIRQIELLTQHSKRFEPPPIITLTFPNPNDGVTNEQAIRAGVDAGAEMKRALSENRISFNESMTTATQHGYPLTSVSSDSGIKIRGLVEKVSIEVLKFDRFMRPLHAKVKLTLIKVQPFKPAPPEVPAKTNQSLSTAMPKAATCPVFEAVRISVKTLRDKYGVTTWSQLVAAANASKLREPSRGAWLQSHCILERNPQVKVTSLEEPIYLSFRRANPLEGIEKTTNNMTASVLTNLGGGSLTNFWAGLRGAVVKKMDTSGFSEDVVVPRRGRFAGAEDSSTRAGVKEPDRMETVEPQSAAMWTSGAFKPGQF